MLFRKNTSYQIRRNYRCEPKFLWNSKASFIKSLGAGRGTIKKKMGACRFWWCPIPNRRRSYWKHVEAMYNMQCINWLETEDEHHQECHPEENIVLKKTFGRILLTCGAGYMEKNLLLATFKFCKVSMKTEF